MSTPSRPTVCVTNEFDIITTSSTTNQLRYKSIPDQAWPYSGSMASCNGLRESSTGGLWVDPVGYVSGLDSQANTTQTGGLPLGTLTASQDFTWTWTNGSGLPQQLIMTTEFRWIGQTPWHVNTEMKTFVGLAAPVAADWTARPVRVSNALPQNTPSPNSGNRDMSMNAAHICQIACAAGASVTIHRLMGITPTAASGTATPSALRWAVASMIWAFNTPSPTTIIN